MIQTLVDLEVKYATPIIVGMFTGRYVLVIDGKIRVCSDGKTGTT
jgi:hypothetical protein